jgi:hypothetical protein
MAKSLSDRKAGTQLVVFLVAKVGMRDAVKIATFLVQWGIVARRKGREPSVGDYLSHWQESPATYYRDLARFRKVWPDDKSPQRRWNWIEANCSLPMKLDPERAAAKLLAGPVPG